MAADIERLRVNYDGLFTDVEHAVLAEWFGQKATSAPARITLDDALAELGFEDECVPYSRTAAAVAYVVREAIGDRLPVWACWNGDQVIKARASPALHQKPGRRAALLLSELFAINWATDGLGFDWPVHYRLTWTPIYERFVVTASADCPDAFGYADFALGHFARTENIGRSVIDIIKRDWTMLENCGQQRWEYLIRDGLVKKPAIIALANEVWPDRN